MYVIPEQLWNQLNVKTWQGLDPHLWECFRLALMEATTEEEVRGVIVEYTKAFNEVITEIESRGVNIEFSPLVLTTTTEMITNIVVSKKDYKSDMLEYLPYYERQSKVFNAILDVYDKEFRRLEQDLDIVDRNMFLDTTIEKLSIYERDLNIRNINKLDYSQRREQISSRSIALFEQTTEETIKSVAGAYGNGEIKILETSQPGVYELKFTGIGIPNNLEGLKKAIDIIIPAHLVIEYVFSFNPWIDVKSKKWSECVTTTWNELREWEGVS